MVNRAARNHARGLGLGTFLSGFVPGLLQYQLGQKRRAAIAFGSCFVLFFVGWMVVKDRLFYWALLTPDTPPNGSSGGLIPWQLLARCGLPVTLPELLNAPANAIGAMLAWDATPNGERLWRMPRDFEHLFGWLTAASGMLAAFWSAAAHWDLRWRRDSGENTLAPIANPALCAGLSWLVPGLGHARAGQKDKGMLMGAAVVIVFAMGLLFSHGHAVDRANASVWWIGQNLFGGGSLFAALVTGPWRMEGAPPQLDLGIVLCTVAGLMNLVVMVDAFTVAERSSFPLPKKTEVTA
jgi:hypothetical protein